MVILNYGIGNLNSIKNMLHRLGVSASITNNPNEILNADKIILPGVGHFDYGMKMLKQSAFFEILNHKATIEKVPILGICLGSQMLLEKSEEGSEPGLGWIKGECKKFNFKENKLKLSIPNMGWNEVEFSKNCALSKNLPDNSRFYFVHSYYMNCENSENSVGTTNYGIKYTCAIQKENIFGVQFHPEKSHKFGMLFLKNFAEL